MPLSSMRFPRGPALAVVVLTTNLYTMYPMHKVSGGGNRDRDQHSRDHMVVDIPIKYKYVLETVVENSNGVTRVVHLQTNLYIKGSNWFDPLPPPPPVPGMFHRASPPLTITNK